MEPLTGKIACVMPDASAPARLRSTLTAMFLLLKVETNFRVNENFEGILESEAMRTGQSKTTVLKAALAAWDNMDENQRNHWLLESAKMG